MSSGKMLEERDHICMIFYRGY